METIYPFKWLDSLVTNTLSPEGPAFIKLGREEIKSVIESLETTKLVLPMDFLHKLLSLKNEQQCKTLVNRYHHQLVLLKEEIRENLAFTKKNILMFTSSARALTNLWNTSYLF